MSSSISEPSRSEEKPPMDSDKPSTSAPESEECNYCKMDRSSSEMISHYSEIKEETHRFCLYCLKYLLYSDGYPAACINCGEPLKEEEYWHVLSPSLKTLVSTLKDEKAIPVKERVYCPDKWCSALHSKTEALLTLEEHFKLNYAASGIAKCKKCKQLFCMNCRVPWHDLISCDEYKKSAVAAIRDADDRELYKIAEKNFWVTCSDCGRILDLDDYGCDNVHCRCGNVFKKTNRKDS